MKLKKLIKSLEIIDVIGDTDKEITEIKTDCNSSTQGSLFVCLKGLDDDGHNYVLKAQKYGAVAVVCQKKLETDLTQIIVKDTRSALSVLASEFYGRADKKLSIIGVVGTNGKTTTTHIIADVLNGAGIKCGVIGTLGVFYGDKFIEPTLTTPDPVLLHKIFSDMVSNGVKAVVMEISAHAIFWKKICGLKFKVGIFTNFSRDHLDFFGDMESYKKVKKEFFKGNACEYSVINSDDIVGIEIAKSAKNTITYGIDNPADVFALNLENTEQGTSFVLNLFDCIYTINLPLIGKFNVSNALACATATALMGVKTDYIAKKLNQVNKVSGRLERVYKGDFSVYVDYAHTPDGLEKSLSALRDITSGKLICLFGCGGNRDQGKRADMGKISGKLADFTVITSDNPRYEEPMEIIKEIENGTLEFSKNYVLIEDREASVEYAINMCGRGDTLLIAGKGGENYQEILGIKRPYNDKDTVDGILRGEGI